MVQQGSRSRLTDRDQAQSIPAGYVFNRNRSIRSRQSGITPDYREGPTLVDC